MSHQTEQLLQCPYNPAHTILRYRMQTHLHKCRKQHEGDDWGYCSHNGTHHMPRSEIAWHENHMCPDRHGFQAMHFTTEDRPVQSLAPIIHIDLPESEENWDDGPVNNFDPAANAEKKSLIRGVHCVPPSERKAFKQSHRRHIQENADDVLTSARLKSVTKKPPKEEHPEAPLRPPRELPRGFVGRGAGSRPNEMAPSPGTASHPSTSSSSPPSLSDSVQWTGLGRGRPVGAPAPTTAAPPTGAWGKGRPKF